MMRNLIFQSVTDLQCTTKARTNNSIKSSMILITYRIVFWSGIQNSRNDNYIIGVLREDHEESTM